MVRIDYEFSDKRMVAEVTLIFSHKIPVKVNILLNTYKIYEEEHDFLWNLSFTNSLIEFRGMLAKKKCELAANGQIYIPPVNPTIYEKVLTDYKRRYLIHKKCKK